MRGWFSTTLTLITIVCLSLTSCNPFDSRNGFQGASPCVRKTILDQKPPVPVTLYAPFGMDVGASGKILVTGTFPGGTGAMTLLSLDSGETWSATGFPVIAQTDAAAILQDGTYMIAGVTNTLKAVVHSSPDGVNWTEVENYGHPPANRAYGRALVQAPNGAVFWAGHGNQFGAGGEFWVTRRSVDGGTTWSLVDGFQLEAGDNSTGTWVGASPGGALFASGSGVSAGKRIWVIRRSTDDGDNWSTVDTFDYAPALNPTEAIFVYAVSDLVIFATGYGYDGAGKKVLITRRSIDGGTTWTTVDNSLSPSGGVAAGNDIAVDSNGTIFVLGEGYANGATTQVIRYSTDNGDSWNLLDEFSYVEGQHTFSYAIRTDDSDSIYVAGMGTDADNFKRWIINQYCPVVP